MARRPRVGSSLLLCMDRSIGHDWDVLTWDRQPDIRRGRRTLLAYARVSRCARCGSHRYEMFEVVRALFEKVGTRYAYSERYKRRERLSSGQVRHSLFLDEVG